MKAVANAYKESKWSLICGSLLGVSLALMIAPNLERWAWATYDHLNPVVKYKAEIIGREDNAVLIHVFGEKLRACECVEKSLQSYAVRNGVYFDIEESRIGSPGSCHPTGQVDVGTWRVWPTKSATHIVMTFVHKCDGRLITSEIARVPL